VRGDPRAAAAGRRTVQLGLQRHCRPPALHPVRAHHPERAPAARRPSRWRCTDKWGGATRQAIHQLSFLDSNPNYACVSGLDSEVVCGCWAVPPPPVAVRPYTVPAAEAAAAPAVAAAAAAAAAGGGNAFSFKGDSRWLGVAKAEGVDTLAGFAASGRVTYARLGTAPPGEAGRGSPDGGGGGA
jgi:hypothetical protein